MPTYRFLNNETGEEFENFMSISALDEYLKQNPNLLQLVNGAPMISSGRGMGKPDQGFRDLLNNIKKKNSGGLSKSTINTF
jgi:hypothetical protein